VRKYLQHGALRAVGSVGYSLPILLLGAGGHAKVILETIRISGGIVSGVIERGDHARDQDFSGVPVLGGDDIVMTYSPDLVLLVNGVGGIGVNPVRKQLFEYFSGRGYQFARVVHPFTWVASDVQLGAGVQVMAGAVLQPGCVVGENSIINTRSSIDHDCVIGQHVHIAPGVTLSGGVRIGTGSHIGTGATIIQGISVGSDALVAAGAVITKDVQDKAVVKGVPGR